MDIITKIKREAKRRKYSDETIKSYSFHVQHFLTFCKKPLSKITKIDIKNYLENEASLNKSGSTLNIKLSAIKFMLHVCGKNWRLNIKFSRKANKIPTFLTKSEIKMFLSVIRNKKHFLMMSLMYSAGLRLSELQNLKKNNLDIDEGYGWVRKGKGNKDRMFIIANKIKSKLKEHIRSLDHNSYLFNGSDGIISRKTIYTMVKNYSKKGGISKNVHPHTLRHSFATHIIENGYDINNLQRLLGHSKIETTNAYIHCAKPKINVRSPLDDF